MKNIFQLLFTTLLVGVIFVTSCKKDPEPTIAEVRVVTSDGEPVPNANVTLACTSSVNKPCEVEITGIADKNGVFTHEFDLPSVLLITAAGNLYDTIINGTIPDTTLTFVKDTICGFSTISIKPEQTNVQTVILYDCK